MHFLISSLLLGVLVACASSPSSYPHLPLKEWNRTENCCQKLGKKWAISSGGSFSSEAGAKIMDLGGNSVDAAIATAFTLAVERPHSLGIGGGGFGVFYFKTKNPQSVFVDFRETAPQKAHRDLYLDSQGNVVPGASRFGATAVATPGFVPGLYAIHKKWGKLSWATLLQPAIELAKKGFPIYPSLAKAIKNESDLLFKQDYLKDLFTREGQILGKGEKLIQMDLSRTLEQISKSPKTELRTGVTAQKLASFIQQSGGILEMEDLKSYQPLFKKPLSFSWKGKRLWMANLPSAGGVLFTEMLEMLSSDPLSVLSESDYTHLLAEVLKRVYADRSSVIGDLPPNKLPSGVLDKERGKNLRNLISFEKSTPSIQIKPLDELPLKDRHTTHLNVVDDKGNAVAMTLTINDHFGARMAVPGTGVFLNNEMDDFSAKPGEQNLFGLSGGKANEIAPGKRPASSMSPTIITDEHGPVLIIGGAGGSRITSQVFQVMVYTLDRPQGSLKQALFHPRIHHQWTPDVLEMEVGFDQAVKESLTKRGHLIREPRYKAIIQGIYRNPQNEWEAVFDPRDEGGVEAQ